MLKLYLASPYGFAESTKPFLEDLKNKLRKAGYEVLDPWEKGEKHLKALTDLDRAKDISLSELQKRNQDLARINHHELDKSDIVVACLDGPDVDSGTASEVGYAAAKGKKIFGYRGDFRQTGENEAALVNMQVQYWIKESEGEIVQTVEELIAAMNELSESSLAEEKRDEFTMRKG